MRILNKNNIKIVFIALVAAATTANYASATPPPSDIPPTCTDVYLIDSGNRFISAPNSYAEVSFAIDDSNFFVKGKLASFDWGAFSACGKQLKLKFRGLSDTIRVIGPVIHASKKQYSLPLRTQPIYFGLRGWGYKEIANTDGEKAIAAINARRSRTATPATGWEWIDRRELYYGKGSKCAMEKSDRCP